jgi:hypothetical protein
MFIDLDTPAIIPNLTFLIYRQEYHKDSSQSIDNAQITLHPLQIYLLKGKKGN